MPRNQTYKNTFASPMPISQWSDPNSQYKFGFNGKEKDSGTCVDGGSFPMAIGIMVRIYDSRLGRWLSLDPMMANYPFYSPYAYVLNTPIQAIDPYGEKVVFVSESKANSVVDDLNRIFKAKYSVDDAFSFTKRVVKFKVLINPIILTNPSTWFRVFQEDDFEAKEIIDYQIKNNENFDWSKDIYTSALFDVINDEKKINVDVVPDANYKYGQGLLQGLGGKYTTSPNSVDLSDKLSQYGDKGTIGAFC